MHASRPLSVGFTIGLLISPCDVFAGHAANHWPIDTAAAQSAPISESPKPDFLLHAEKNYAEAQTALRAEEDTLERLRHEEANLRRAALAKSGSWIEPAEWWQKKQAIKQSILLKNDAVRRAKSKLTIAQSHAQALAESHRSKKHKPSWFRSWWQW